MTEPSYRDQLRAKVIEIARAIVVTEGVEAAQARRIAKQADCAVGSLYNVFGDIDGLILALNAQTLAVLGEELARAVADAQSSPLRARLDALAIGYLRFAIRNRGLWDAVFRYRRKSPDTVPQTYLEDQARLLALIEREIAPAVVDQAERNQAARALFGSVHGIVTLAIDDRLGGEGQNDYEAQIRFIVGLVAKGLGSPESAA